jgi:NarL family two-component system response regulator LiaR
MVTILVLFIDPHRMTYDAFTRAFATEIFARVRPVATLAAAKDEISLATPDLVLFEPKVPDGDVLVSLSLFAKSKIVCCTGQASPSDIERAFSAGADGFVDRSQPIEELLYVCREVLDGAAGVLDRESSKTMQRHYKERNELTVESGLTEQELKVLLLVSQGRSNAQIAAEMFIARSTVAKILHSATYKLGMSDRTSAAVAAVRLGMLS